MTVAGESAGAMSVGALLSMPRAQGLFQRAVGPERGRAPRADGGDRGQGRRRAGRAARRPADPGSLAAVDPQALVQAQAALSQEIAALPDPVRWGEVALNLMAFEPVIDGDVLPALPIRGIEGGVGAGVDVLTGSNSDEHALFLVPNGFVDLVDANVLGLVAQGYGLPTDALDLYRSAAPDASPGELLIALASDWFFRIPAVRLAEARTAGPGRTFLYEFAWPSPQFGGRLGACHALEIPFVFDTLDAPGSEGTTGPAAPRELAETVHRAWVDFATTGDPGWPAYDLDARPVQVFGTLTGVTPDPRAEQRRAWDGVRV